MPKIVWDDIVPVQNDSINLGSILQRFKDIFLSGRITYANAFTVEIPANAGSVIVQFPAPFPSSSSPIVICTPSYQTSFWITEITNSQFVINLGTAPGIYSGGGTIYVIAMMQK
jgi:hypothetical protein